MWNVDAAPKAPLWHVGEMLSVRWLSQQPSHGLDHIKAPGSHRLRMVVVPSHVQQRVPFPLPKRLIVRHNRHMLLTPSPFLELVNCNLVFFSFKTS